MAETNLSVIGFGLMGGSIAKALKRRGKYRVTAYDTDPAVLKKAEGEGLAAVYTSDALQAVKEADIVVVCLYPKAAADFILSNMEAFKPGAVITDICGVKRLVCDEVFPHLRKDVAFVPGHPMAGREKKGLAMSDGSLFDGCNYLVAANENAPGVKTVREFAYDLGAGRVVFTEPEKHDKYIAYTSQLPHAISCAYVRCMEGRPVIDHSAGSLKDVSRVADINAGMWSELFIENADNLARECGRLAEELMEIARYIREGDETALGEYMRTAADAMEKRNE
jgi:prephenate dehydrogenase